MRNFLIALLIIGLPALAVIGFLLYGPELYDKIMREDSPLDHKFSTVIGDTVAVGKMDDYSVLDSIPSQSGAGHKNGLSRSEQVTAALNKSGDTYYHDVHIDEVINRNTEFYDLNASNPDELRRAILANAPANADSGKHSISKMSYGVDWSLDTVQENGECKLLGAKVVTTITMMMPRWNGVENMGEDARKAWGDYLTSVASYGERHNKIMEGVSRQIADRIRFIKKHALCSELITDVNKIGTSMLSDARDRVKRYRSETGAGRQMGVRLPVFADSDLATNQEMTAVLNQADNAPSVAPVVVAEASAEEKPVTVEEKSTKDAAKNPQEAQNIKPVEEKAAATTKNVTDTVAGAVAKTGAENGAGTGVNSIETPIVELKPGLADNSKMSVESVGLAEGATEVKAGEKDSKVAENKKEEANALPKVPESVVPAITLPKDGLANVAVLAVKELTEGKKTEALNTSVDAEKKNADENKSIKVNGLDASKKAAHEAIKLEAKPLAVQDSSKVEAASKAADDKAQPQSQSDANKAEEKKTEEKK